MYTGMVCNQVFIGLGELSKKSMSKRKATTEVGKLFPLFAAKKSVPTPTLPKQFRYRADSGDHLKIVTWNVAGLKGLIKKGNHSFIKDTISDIIVLQETKCDVLPEEIGDISLYGYKKLFPSTTKKGYSGVCLLSREQPLKVECGLGDKEIDGEGRVVIAEYEHFYLIAAYVPNSGRQLVNESKRRKYEGLLSVKIKELDLMKPVIYVGDLNVAHTDIDIANPKSNYNKSPGFFQFEMDFFTDLLSAGFKDVFRTLNPDLTKAYTFWSYMSGARAKNVGWRLDYFVISNRIMDKVKDCQIMNEVMGSDHCPVSMTIDLQ
uniref:DNA-(apurinic or apyrimidinic site) endonuclease n=1 Tax=Rhabditophanes sp. KR3021 TaxID=114890 RepID=A0AC35U0P8_9BILA